LGLHNVWAVRFPRRHADLAKSFWQHCGDGVSSRLAEACLTGQVAEPAADAKAAIRGRVARLAGVSSEDVFLFPCGMSAMFCLHRVLTGLHRNRKTVQFGFPYVDTLKVQEKFGAGVHFFARGDADDAAALDALLAKDAIGGLYTEFPSNPLLISPDMERLGRLAREHEFPLIVDDTVASFFNADVLSVADVVCSSLTKYFSGVGDVTGGALLVNRRSPFSTDLLERIAREFEDVVWGADAVVLEQNSRDFEARLPRVNSSAECLADYLQSHRQVADVFYPKFQTPALYRQFVTPRGGFGGLLSLVLHDAASATPQFFDALAVSKGPNLGTNYTLACPYTILAHYRELDFAEACGVSRYLIRVAVGLEDPDDLIQRFKLALAAT
jgi:cystathionine gamma-synthase